MISTALSSIPPAVHVAVHSAAYAASGVRPLAADADVTPLAQFNVNPSPAAPPGSTDLTQLLNWAMWLCYGAALAGLLTIGVQWFFAQRHGDGGGEMGKIGKWGIGMMFIGGAGGVVAQLAGN